MQISDARNYFEEMGCSHFHMSREDPVRYLQYQSLSITSEQERSWRRERIDAVATALMAGNSPDWKPFTQLIALCEQQGDIESLQSLGRTIEAVSKELSPKGSVIVAESLIGTATYHFNQGPIHMAVKLNQNTIARHLVESALSLATGADVAEPARSAAAVKKCAAVKEHFKL